MHHVFITCGKVETRKKLAHPRYFPSYRYLVSKKFVTEQKLPYLGQRIADYK